MRRSTVTQQSPATNRISYAYISIHYTRLHLCNERYSPELKISYWMYTYWMYYIYNRGQRALPPHHWVVRATCLQLYDRHIM